MELPPMPVPLDLDEEIFNYTDFVLSTLVASYAVVVGMIDALGLARVVGLTTLWSTNSTSSSADVLSEAFVDAMHEPLISGIPIAIFFSVGLLPPDSIPSALFGRISAESNEETFGANHASRVSALCLVQCSFAFILNMIVAAQASNTLGGKAMIYLCVGVLQAVFLLLSVFYYFTSFLTHRGALQPRRIRKYESTRSPEYVREATWVWKYVNYSVWSTLSMFCLLIIDAIFAIKDDWRPYFVLIFTLLSSFAVAINLYVISDYSTFTFVMDSEDNGLAESSGESDRPGAVPSAEPVEDKNLRQVDDLAALPQRSAGKIVEPQVAPNEKNRDPSSLEPEVPPIEVSPAEKVGEGQDPDVNRDKEDLSADLGRDPNEATLPPKGSFETGDFGSPEHQDHVGPNESHQPFDSLKPPPADFFPAKSRNVSGSSGETRTFSGSGTTDQTSLHSDEGYSHAKVGGPRTLKYVEKGPTTRNQNDRSSALKRDSVGSSSVVDHGPEDQVLKDNHVILENLTELLKMVDRLPRGEQTVAALKVVAAISAQAAAQAEERFVSISARTERGLAALSDQTTAQTKQGLAEKDRQLAELSAQVTALSKQVTAKTEQGLAEKDQQLTELSAQVKALSERVTASSESLPERQDPSTKESEGVAAPHGGKDLSIQDQENPSQSRPESSAGRPQRSSSPTATILRKAKGSLRKFSP